MCDNATLGTATVVLFVASLVFLGFSIADRVRKDRELAKYLTSAEDASSISNPNPSSKNNDRDVNPRFALTFLISFVAFVSYFMMWLSKGVSPTASNSFIHSLLAKMDLSPVARYVDWLITTPLLLIDLLWYVTKKSRYDLVSVVVLDVIMIVLGGIAAFILRGFSRYFMWLLSTLAMLGIFAYLLYYRIVPASRDSSRGDESENKKREHAKYNKSMLWVLVLWSLYPIVWLLSPVGFGVLNGCAETVIYAILDIVAKVGFGAFLLFVF